MSRSLIIGTRGSKLALVQSEQMAESLRQCHPGLSVELRIISTKGDRVLDVALSRVGDKGLFVKELEVALQQGEVDLAVHSGKDLPSLIPDDLTLAAFPRRVNPHDALVLPRHNGQAAPAPVSLDVLPHGAIVGTSSLRRASQLRALRPDLQLRDVRGNVDTRLRKLDEGQYDALVLAAAGLTRLGLADRISLALPSDVLLPAVAQGALAIEARRDDDVTLELLAALDDPDTRVAVLAERACLRRLEGGCQVPIAAHAEVQPGSSSFRLRGLVGALDGSQVIRAEREGSRDDPESAGLALADELLDMGAADLLAEQRDGAPAVLTAPPPLHGWRVIVTRSEAQADSLNEALRQQGAEPVAYPTIAFAPPEDEAALDHALLSLMSGSYNWLVLTSVMGVQTVHARLQLLSATFQTNHTLPAGLQVAAVGATTAEACTMLLGSKPAVVPEKFVAESLAESLGDLNGQRVLLAQADLSRPVLAEQLRQAGANLDAVIAYRTVPATGGADVPALLAEGVIDAITFTSSSTVRNFVERIGPAALPQAQQAIIACIGPVTAEAAQEVGLTPSIVAELSTIEGLVDALVAWRHRTREQTA